MKSLSLRKLIAYAVFASLVGLIGYTVINLYTPDDPLEGQLVVTNRNTPASAPLTEPAAEGEAEQPKTSDTEETTTGAKVVTIETDVDTSVLNSDPLSGIGDELSDPANIQIQLDTDSKPAN